MPGPRRPRHPAPWNRPRERRLCQRLATGLTPAQAAKVEGASEAEVLALLASPEFAGLVEGYRQLDAMDPAERMAMLERIARIKLMDALADGDIRVVLFFLRERGHGRDPARTLAERAAAAPRAVVGPPRSRPTPPGETTPDPLYDPSFGAIAKGAASTRDELAAEEAARAAAGMIGPPGPEVAPAPAVSAGARESVIAGAAPAAHPDARVAAAALPIAGGMATRTAGLARPRWPAAP